MNTFLIWQYLENMPLLNYKRKSHYLANFSCPVCNEAITSHHTRKKRAYFIEKHDSVYFYCHRCGAAMPGPEFIKHQDSNLFRQYYIDVLKENGKYKEKKPIDFSIKHITNSALCAENIIYINFPTIQDLEEDHFAKKYVKERKIPKEKWNKIYFIPKFMKYINTLLPNKFSEETLSFDEGRLCFPFFNEKGIYHGIQGRSFLYNSKKKYIMIVLDETIPSVYGLDSIDWNKLIYVTEGPIDSFFLPNSIASIGGDIISKIKDLPNKDNMILIFDNEPRSIHMKDKMKKAIEQEYKLVIWPDNLEGKDINEMILFNNSKEKIFDIINSNIWGGKEIQKTKAMLRLNAWVKI